MSEVTLPHGWTSITLAELFQPRNTRVNPKSMPDCQYIGLEHVEPHTNKLLATVPAKIMSSSSARFFAGDILYGRMRPYLNKVVMPEFDGLASAEFIVLPKTQGVYSKYIVRFLSNSKFVEFACSQYDGDRPRVKYEQLAKYRLMLPPTEEQRRIVEKIEVLLAHLDDAVINLERIKTNFKRYRASVLQAAVEGRLTAEWRKQNPPSETGAELLARLLKERRAKWEENQLKKYAEQGKTPPKDWKEKYPEPVKPDTAGLPKLPDGWVWATADQLSPNDISNGRSVPTANSGPRVLRLTAIKNGCIDLLEFKYGSWSQEEAAPYIINKGDLLIARGNGSLSLVGRMGLVKTVVEPTAFPDTMIRLKVLESVINSTWIAKYWDTRQIRKHLEQRARTSAGIYKISQPDILSAPVAIPPILEQDEIVLEVNNCISYADAAGRVIDSALQRANQLRQSILKRAFVGRLVPQDPNDEPASMLLERIRAEQAKQAAPVKPARTKRKGKSDAN